MANKNLTAAKRAKNDEFYTRLQDIEAELVHYRQQFKDKTVFLNCDDPTWSAFWLHFHTLFGVYGLKKLISTHYESDDSASYAMVYEGGDDADASVGERIELIGNGDFRSDECIEFLKESDIVVTNPPFSLFREYVAQLIEYDKKFLIIGNINAITYKDVFPLIKDDKLWPGVNKGGSRKGNTLLFSVSDDYTSKSVIEDDDHRYAQVSAWWFTNLDIKKRHEDLFLSATYYKKDGSVPQASLERWPRYDNYDAIEVSKTKDIPVDYEGVMGVPITFLDKYNPEQFELLGCSTNHGRPKEWPEDTDMRASVNGKNIYKRLFIRARHPHPAGVPVMFDDML